MTVPIPEASRAGGYPASITMFVLLVAATLALSWPAWINGSPLLFFDSPGYIKQGQTAVENTLALLRTSPEPARAGSGGEGATGFAAAASTGFIRSLGYSGFAYLGSLTPLGVFGVVLAQAAIVAGVIGILLSQSGRGQRNDMMVAAALCIVLTPLPWFTSYLMPDILAAVPILCAIIIVRGLDGVGWAARLYLFGAASFASLAHYGHPPLAVGVGLVTLAILGLQWRLSIAAVVLALAPPVTAGLVNMAGSQVAFKEASVAPKRLPLLLARSIADGPARWHLEANCPEYRYAICELYDEIPSDLGRLLWSADGITRRASLEQVTRIREEEPLILRRAFLEYPLHQTWSLVGNSVSQMWTLGTSDFRWGHLGRRADGELVRQATGREGLSVVAKVHLYSTLAAIALIAFWAWRDGLRIGRREREMLLVALAGLAINAAIFGGLSAPAERYQSRVIWILPLLAALYWLARREAAVRQCAER